MVVRGDVYGVGRMEGEPEGKKMHILFLFVDGIGLGPDDPDVNPFARFRLPSIERLADGQRWLASARSVRQGELVFKAIDANLDLEGLPQSGTGQATLFTGVNCARVAGRHYGPYPHSKTKAVIAERNMFTQLQALFPDEDEPSAFANAYPKRFFDYVKERDRWTVTTRCCLDSGTRIRGRDDLQAGLAVPADLTGTKWPETARDGEMPADEAAAARRLLAISTRHRLTLFEYFQTDKAGHAQSFERSREVLEMFDRLIGGLLGEMDRATTLLLITSDHGNLEDLSTKSHTRNPVPLIACGHRADTFADVKSLVDVTPTILQYLAPSE